MSTPSARLVFSLPSFAAEPPESWSRVVDVAMAADRTGVDRVVVSDHVAFGERLDQYARPELGGQAGGRQPTGPDGHWLEPLTTLAVVSGSTSRVRLGTMVLQAALRRPVVLAKMAATLDVLSGGRLDLGVGVGWQREEYEAAGLAFETRGRQLDHTLEVCQTLWRDQRASYTSPELTFERIHQMPKPVQSGGVPIWVSGTVNPAVVRRLARFGVGWIPWGPDARDTDAISRMKQALVAHGREDVDELRVVGSLPPVLTDDGLLDVEATMADVAPLVEAGVTDVSVPARLPRSLTAVEDHLGRLVSAFHGAVA